MRWQAFFSRGPSESKRRTLLVFKMFRNVDRQKESSLISKIFLRFLLLNSPSHPHHNPKIWIGFQWFQNLIYFIRRWRSFISIFYSIQIWNILIIIVHRKTNDLLLLPFTKQTFWQLYVTVCRYKRLQRNTFIHKIFVLFFVSAMM